MENSARIFRAALRFSFILIVIIWAVHILSLLVGTDLGHWGIYPRRSENMIGIITAPLIHGGWEHLISNSVPLFVSSTIIHFFYKRVAWPSFFLIYVLTGFAVWLFGRSVYHIGASGVVYGLISFIFWSGVFRRNIKSIVLALVVTILYSGYLSGILPFQEGISWESHLLGAVVGVLVAALFRNNIERDEVHEDPWADESDDTEYFLNRGAFDKTKAERQRERDEEDFLHI